MAKIQGICALIVQTSTTISIYCSTLICVLMLIVSWPGVGWNRRVEVTQIYRNIILTIFPLFVGALLAAIGFGLAVSREIHTKNVYQMAI